LSRFTVIAQGALLSSVLSLMCTSPALAQSEELHEAVLSQIREEGLERSQVMEHVIWLADVYGPRQTGSPGKEQAGAWAMNQLREWGFDVRQDRFQFGKGWSLERFSAHMLEPQVQPMIGMPKSWTVGTGGAVTADVVAAHIETHADMDRLRGQLRGKILLTQPARSVEPLEFPTVLRMTEREFREVRGPRPSGDGGGASGAPAVPRPSQQEIQAFYEAEGAIALLDRGFDDTLTEGGSGISWVTQRTDGGTIFVGRGGPVDEGAGQGLPSVTLAVEHYNRMIRVLERGVPVRMELDVRTRFHDEVQPNAFNIIAEIPGTDPLLRDEIVILGAHFDSHHGGTGAVDNATGSAAMMEAGRILQAIGARPRRTIQIALWGAEEHGLRGSRHYVRTELGDRATGAVKPGHDKVSAYFNVDNGTGRIRGIWGQDNAAAQPIFAEWIKPLNDLGVEVVSPWSVPSTDHVAFDEVGVPGFNFLQDRIEYRSRTHHSTMDVVDRVQPDDMRQIAVVAATFAYLAAQRDDMMPRKPLPEPFADRTVPDFAPVQVGTFSSGGALSNAWADFSGNGELDLFVGFVEGRPNRLYRNDAGVFTEVGSEMGVADTRVTRAASWGDYNGNGRPDLLVGYATGDGPVLRLYRNDGDRFTDVTRDLGLIVDEGAVRQMSWVDVDMDGRLDLFIAFRDRPNALFRNEGGRFVDIAPQVGLADDRRSIGAVWFDYDGDGDLDLYVAGQNGDANALFRNDGGRFTDVAEAAGVAWGGRAPHDPSNGTIRPCVGDVNGNGLLDIFSANYGPNGLFLNQGDGTFEDVSEEWGVAIDGRYDSCAFADINNNGRLDLYVNGTVTGGVDYPDYLFLNTGTGYKEITPQNMRDLPGSHGAQWADFDGDGLIDLASARSPEDGTHVLWRNRLAAADGRVGLRVLVVDGAGALTRAGTEVRLYAAGTRRLLGTQIVDTGSGYNSQNSGPVHFGLRTPARVDIELAIPTRNGRVVATVPNVNPADWTGRLMILRAGQDGAVALAEGPASAGSLPARDP
jgi:carboxypeptidase Q